MAKTADILSVLLLAAAGGAFSLGVLALGDQRDLQALYWLLLGAILLRSAVDILRPRAGGQ